MTLRPVLAAVAVVVLVSTARPARADLFDEANRDYQAQHYEAAIAKYEQLVREGGRHEVLYYNLGNAYFRAAVGGLPDRLGRAILNYERALVLDPDFADARFNLDVARELAAARHGKDTVVGAAGDPLWVRVVTWVPPRTLGWVFLVLDVIFFATLIALRFLPTGFLRTGLVVTTVFVGVGGVLSLGLLCGQIAYRATVHVSIVVADEVVMREGPDQSRRELPKLHAGHRVVVVRESHGWARVRLANEMEGWVPKPALDEL